MGAVHGIVNLPTLAAPDHRLRSANGLQCSTADASQGEPQVPHHQRQAPGGAGSAEVRLLEERWPAGREIPGKHNGRRLSRRLQRTGKEARPLNEENSVMVR